MAKRKGSSASGPRTRSEAAEERREARDAENSKRLDKLPQEVWEKIFDILDEDNLFPLALSCRYFRQKQKELVARTRQKGPGREKVLKTNLQRKLEEGQPASADYLQFCSKEKASSDDGQEKALSVRYLAAFHGHLPLLQELLEPLKTLDGNITGFAGEYSSSQFRLLLVLSSDSLSLCHSEGRPTGDLAVA